MVNHGKCFIYCVAATSLSPINGCQIFSKCIIITRQWAGSLYKAGFFLSFPTHHDELVKAAGSVFTSQVIESLGLWSVASCFVL